jgi:hypothetical protein
MKKYYLILLLIGLLGNNSFATSDPARANTSWEVTFIKGGSTPDLVYQAQLRERADWQGFLAENGTWYVHFNENNALPHRAYGQPIATQGSGLIDRAQWFIQNKLDGFSIPASDLVLKGTPMNRKHQIANFSQVHEGMEVLGSQMLIKMDQSGNVILFSADVYPSIEIETESLLMPQQAAVFSTAGLNNIEIISAESDGNLKILPIPVGRETQFRLVYEVWIDAQSGDIPSRFYTLVDAANGQVWYRQDKIVHVASDDPSNPHKNCSHGTRSLALPLTVAGTTSGQINLTHPFEAPSNAGLPFMAIIINGTTYYTNAEGNFNIPVNGPVTATVRLSGNWCKIETNGTTPQFTTILAEGNANTILVDAPTNIRERSAFYSTNAIHEHMKEWMPSFTGLDYALTTNIDVAGECNAFYDGNSINFYNLAGGCNATSLIYDVVFHEYGHGINDKYYQSLGSSFMNGGMNEGYADFWALSLTESPLLGVGFYTTNDDPLRRYDEDPKVYPVDLVGEVHADGEIICGAWYDSHVLMGNNWDLTMDLFIQAFAGLQANTFNGNEGVAFTDVLIDLLQADDDDNDISNGTPNGNAIVEGFDIHGISLISNATLTHDDLTFAPAEEGIEINATLVLTFPFNQYLEDAVTYYRINDSNVWTELPMVNTGGNNYQVDLPAQPEGTVIAYYLAARDVNNVISNVTPVAAHLDDPNIPFYILVGYELVGVHDCDINEDFGIWTPGIGGDNATTGEWELDIPIGSFSEPGNLSTVVAPYDEHTGGADGELCYITGNSSAADAPLGENDVDGGKTTLQSPIIDLTEYDNPAITYWRWYTNSPPSGANPGADWWEVLISDDGGDSWVHVEKTKSSDISWRRHAFRVADYVDLTDEIRMRFIASDSLRPGEYLDGGSLVEAAFDDFHLYDLGIPDNVSENEIFADVQMWPNPANLSFTADFTLIQSSAGVIRLFDLEGREVYSQNLGSLSTGKHRLEIPVGSLAEGMYIVQITFNESSNNSRITVVH